MNIGNQYSYVPRQNYYTASKAGKTNEVFTVPAAKGQAGKLFQTQSLFKHHHGNVITFEDLHAEAADAQTAFQSGLTAALAGSGVDTSQPICLKSDASGRVYVANDHPDKDIINAILEQNPAVANEFRHVSSLTSIIAAGKETKAFQEAYAKNPAAAVARYGYLFANKQDDVFSMFIKAGKDGALEIALRWKKAIALYSEKDKSRQEN